MNLYDHQVKELQTVKKLLDALHMIANPSFDDPVAAKAVWEAVRNALDAQGLNYASIINGRVTVDFVLRRANETESV